MDRFVPACTSTSTSSPSSRFRVSISALCGVLVQAGTNLSMLRLADEAERWIGKPVVTVNSATLWHALRAYGIEDRFEGFGTLLRDH